MSSVPGLCERLAATGGLSAGQTAATGGWSAGGERPSAAAAAHANAAVGHPAVERVALVYAVTGDLRYLAHQDELRMLIRALVRARWPLAYRGGFNPRPRLTIPLPRNLGTAAQRQWAVADLHSAASAADLLAGAREQMPPACPVLTLYVGLARRNLRPLRVTYRVPLESADAGAVDGQMRELLERTAVVTDRNCGPRKRSRRLDIRPHIESLWLDGPYLCMTLRFADQRIARPMEIITELGLSAQRYEMRIERTRVQWDRTLAGPEFGPESE